MSQQRKTRGNVSKPNAELGTVDVMRAGAELFKSGTNAQHERMVEAAGMVVPMATALVAMVPNDIKVALGDAFKQHLELGLERKKFDAQCRRVAHADSLGLKIVVEHHMGQLVERVVPKKD